MVPLYTDCIYVISRSISHIFVFEDFIREKESMLSVCVSVLVWLQSLNLFGVVLPSGCSHGFLLLFPTCQKYYISTMKFRFFLLYCCDNSLGFKQWMISHLCKRMLCCKLVEINVSTGGPAGPPWGSSTASHWRYRRTHSLYQCLRPGWCLP